MYKKIMSIFSKLAIIVVSVFMLLFAVIGMFAAVIGMDHLLTVNTLIWRTYKMNGPNISFKYPPTWHLKTVITEDSELVKLTGLSGEFSLIWLKGDIGGGCPIENQEKMKILGEEQLICHYNGRVTPNDENWYTLTKTKDKIAVQFGVSIYRPNDNLRNAAIKILESMSYFK